MQCLQMANHNHLILLNSICTTVRYPPCKATLVSCELPSSVYHGERNSSRHQRLAWSALPVKRGGAARPRIPPPLQRGPRSTAQTGSATCMFERSEFASCPVFASTAGQATLRGKPFWVLLGRMPKVPRPPGRNPACLKKTISSEATETTKNHSNKSSKIRGKEPIC